MYKNYKWTVLKDIPKSNYKKGSILTFYSPVVGWMYFNPVTGKYIYRWADFRDLEALGYVRRGHDTTEKQKISEKFNI